MRQTQSFFRKQNIYFPCVKSSAGTTVSLATTLSFGPQTQRYIGARLLRSYVPLRCGPSESGAARDTIVAAYVLHVLYYFCLRKKD